MFRKNTGHQQKSFLGNLNDLPSKQQQRLEQSWAGTFYDEIFSRIDEAPYAALYADKPSRPNIAVNILVGLEILKASPAWVNMMLAGFTPLASVRTKTSVSLSQDANRLSSGLMGLIVGGMTSTI